MYIKHKFIFIVLFFTFLGVLKSQEIVINISDNIEVIDGKSFYIHTVAKGQTLYSIAKAYDVSLNEIMNINPETKYGLSINQLIKIPIKKEFDTLFDKAFDSLEIVSNDNYIEHIVKYSETLFSIAKNYKINVSNIMAINPDLSEAIIPGQRILIPVSEKEVIKNEENIKQEYRLHTVKKKETLYAIAKSYLVSIAEIEELNPESKNNIKEGQILKIPLKTERLGIQHLPASDTLIGTSSSRFDSKYCDAPILESVYNVAFIMPFYLNSVYEVNVPETDDIMPQYKSLTFIEFYEGALLAIDSLRKQGLNIKLFVYDDNNDTIALAKLLTKSEIKNIDLFIGPFFINSFDIIKKYAKKNNIKIVNPLSPRLSIINNNPNVFKVVPSNITQYAQLAIFLPTLYPNANIIIVNNINNTNSITEIEFLKKQIILSYSKAGRSDSVVNLVHYFKNSFQSVVSNLKPSAENIVITFANDEIFYISYLRNLRSYAQNYDIRLFSPSSITKFENIEISYLQDLNLSIFSPHYIDYSKDETKGFIVSFRERFNTEPDFYAFAGYDICMYFLKALHKYGKEFQHCLENNIYEGLQTNFEFKTNNERSGFENKSLYIYSLEEYKWVKIK